MIFNYFKKLCELQNLQEEITNLWGSCSIEFYDGGWNVGCIKISGLNDHIFNSLDNAISYLKENSKINYLKYME